MKKPSQEEWADIMGDYVAGLAELSHDAYQKLYPPPEGKIQVPTQAEPFCGIVADGVIGMLMMLNSIESDFDSLQLFLEELSLRLAGMGYVTMVDPQMDPEIHKRACEVVEDAMKPPEGTVKQ